MAMMLCFKQVQGLLPTRATHRDVIEQTWRQVHQQA